MELSSLLSTQDLSITRAQVDGFNKSLNGTTGGQTLEKDDFLKLLITQLTNQDPTEPMKDREFIAQMAQFSTLEQMTNMSQDFGRLAGILSTTQALGLLGKTVEISDGIRSIEGVVEEVIGREYPKVLVNGEYFDFELIEGVKE